MNENRVRIVDIAEALGVSTATVSNVIHGKTKKISDETVKRVQELLEEKKYIPSMAELLLAQNDSRIIGVVVNDHKKYENHVLEDIFISSSLNYLSDEIKKAGYFMMVKTTRDLEEITRFASMWNMEGLIAIGFCDEYKNLKNFLHIPFVVYDGFVKKQERLCNLIVDNYDGGYKIGQYFYNMGHRKVLCISDNDICGDLERYKGFSAAMKEGRADFMLIPMKKEERNRFYKEKLEELKEYSAIFAVSDYYAIDLMHFLRENEIIVPNDISVAGFDDSPLCEMVYPTLTTIRQDGRKRAELAVEMIKKLKNENDSGITVTLPVTLIERQSVKRI